MTKGATGTFMPCLRAFAPLQSLRKTPRKIMTIPVKVGRPMTGKGPSRSCQAADVQGLGLVGDFGKIILGLLHQPAFRGAAKGL